MLREIELLQPEFQAQIKVLQDRTLGNFRRAKKFNELEMPEHTAERTGKALGRAVRLFAAEQGMDASDITIFLAKAALHDG